MLVGPPPVPVGRALCEARSQPVAVSADPGNDRLSKSVAMPPALRPVPGRVPVSAP
ncbi:hypothetical protein HOE425_50008 [Hoeflea sp. EC-HK425]|nr:hypothetical protein HOE425_50008 [Hoeflea sp. EC-HK425]